jgi:hypothetical protein
MYTEIDYYTLVHEISKRKAQVLLSSNSLSAQLEAIIREKIASLPAAHLIDTMKYHALLVRHTHKEPPNTAGMYLKLTHGRTTSGEEMNDWGSDGPWIGPLHWFHCTYLADIGIGFTSGEELVAMSANELIPSPIFLIDDMIYLDGVYYGDWELQQIPDNSH